MRRVLYAAGVNTKSLAAAADPCPYWLLSMALMPRKGPPSYLEPFLTRQILWDPGTFSIEARTYPAYRDWIARHVQAHHKYLAYDEIGGDPELNLAYLRDMRRRGLSPIPVYHQGMPRAILAEPMVAIGGLVPLTDSERQDYLDWVFYGPEPRPAGHVHLLGVWQRKWFGRYPATSGDATTWIPRFPYNQAMSMADWLKDFGEQDIPFSPPSMAQGRLAL